MKKIITKKELADLYYSKTTEEVCKILNIARPTLYRYLKNCGIKKKHDTSNFGKKIIIKD